MTQEGRKDYLDLTGRVALVTGVARLRGVGACVARLLASQGAIVVATDIDPSVQDRVQEIKDMGHECIGMVADLTDLESVKKLSQDIYQKFGRIDILVNVAGKSVPPRPPFLEMDEEYWNTVIDRNLKTTVNTCWSVLPFMIENKYGRVINISSITGPKCAYRFSAAYAASKGAVSGLTKALSLEMGEHGVTVMSILPGDIDTRDNPWHLKDGRRDLGKLSDYLAPPITRPARSEEIADLTLFLASDKSSYITGSEIVIDGGATIVEPLPNTPQ